VGYIGTFNKKVFLRKQPLCNAPTIHRIGILPGSLQYFISFRYMWHPQRTEPELSISQLYWVLHHLSTLVLLQAPIRAINISFLMFGQPHSSCHAQTIPLCTQMGQLLTTVPPLTHCLSHVQSTLGSPQIPASIFLSVPFWPMSTASNHFKFLAYSLLGLPRMNAKSSDYPPEINVPKDIFVMAKATKHQF